MEKLRVLECFAGYGSQSMSLRDINVDHEVVGISEIEPNAIIAYGSIRFDLDELKTDKTYDEMKAELMAKNVGWDFQKQKSRIPRMKKDKLEMLYKFDKVSNNYGDISIINPNDLPDFDYFTYSFPCQDISVSGKQNGIEKGKTRSGLLYECEKIIETKKPKYLLMENVKNLVGKKFIDDFNGWLNYLESLGYKNYWKVLNAKNYGIAQNRERVFCISILGDETYEFPNGFKLEKRLKDFLDNSIEDKYYLSEEIQNRFKQTKTDNGENNVIGTTAPEFRIIGQRDLVYGNESCANGTLVATDYKQPKQIIDYSDDKPYLVGGFGDKNFGKQYRQGNRVYDSEGVAMCLCSNPVGNMGGNSYLYKVEDKIVINDKENFRYKPSGENVIGEMGGDLWEKRHEQTRRVYDTEKVSPTIPTCSGGGQHPKILEHNTICEQRCDEGLRFFKDNVCGTIRTINSGGDKRVIETEPTFRIRKLTPKECLRLMGVSDEDISKMQSTGLSDSSLYKLAGNSIVKQCLDYIHVNLFKETINNENDTSTPS